MGLIQGSSDTNSYKAPILPWLRSIDGLNTHDRDAAYELAIAGGVTTPSIATRLVHYATHQKL
jgi:hypothetical protein